MYSNCSFTGCSPRITQRASIDRSQSCQSTTSQDTLRLYAEPYSRTNIAEQFQTYDMKKIPTLVLTLQHLSIQRPLFPHPRRALSMITIRIISVRVDKNPSHVSNIRIG